MSMESSHCPRCGDAWSMHPTVCANANYGNNRFALTGLVAIEPERLGRLHAENERLQKRVDELLDELKGVRKDLHRAHPEAFPFLNEPSE